jgi:hypothetical protein
VQLCGGEPEGRPGQRHQLLLLRCGAQGTRYCSAHAWVRPASVLQVLYLVCSICVPTYHLVVVYE